jgi:uncharacterized surface protein with fasciclin (FAS1) repeats
MLRAQQGQFTTTANNRIVENFTKHKKNKEISIKKPTGTRAQRSRKGGGLQLKTSGKGISIVDEKTGTQQVSLQNTTLHISLRTKRDTASKRSA